jgi:hypothetical protein
MTVPIPQPSCTFIGTFAALSSAISSNKVKSLMVESGVNDDSREQTGRETLNAPFGFLNLP